MKGRRSFGKFSNLLGSLLALLVGSSFMGEDRISVAAFCLLSLIVLLAAITTVCRRHKTLGLGLAFVVAISALNIGGYAAGSSVIFVLHNLAVMSFFAFASYHILCAILHDDEVTLDTIVGAVCLYLLAGLFWTHLYGAILLVDSKAFETASSAPQTRASPVGGFGFHPMAYFSFVTMTTLGFGDITPASRPARTASILQAVFGQFFLAVFVARLVAFYIAAAKGKA